MAMGTGGVGGTRGVGFGGAGVSVPGRREKGRRTRFQWQPAPQTEGGSQSAVRPYWPLMLDAVSGAGLNTGIEGVGFVRSAGKRKPLPRSMALAVTDDVAVADPSLTGTDTGPNFGQGGTLILGRSPQYIAQTFHTGDHTATSAEDTSLGIGQAGTRGKRKPLPISRAFSSLFDPASDTGGNAGIDGVGLSKFAQKRKPIKAWSATFTEPITPTGSFTGTDTGTEGVGLTVSRGKRKPNPRQDVFDPNFYGSGTGTSVGLDGFDLAKLVQKRKPLPKSNAFVPPVHFDSDTGANAGIEGVGLAGFTQRRRIVKSWPKTFEPPLPISDSFTGTGAGLDGIGVTGFAQRRRIIKSWPHAFEEPQDITIVLDPDGGYGMAAMFQKRRPVKSWPHANDPGRFISRDYTPSPEPASVREPLRPGLASVRFRS